MNILVATASKHGSTAGIAEAIAAELRMMGNTVDVQDIRHCLGVGQYDAVILGSAVYMGNWLPEAHQFVASHRSDLAERPVWLFSSGPLGWDNPMPKDDPAHLDELMRSTGARGHQIFVGKLDKSGLNLGERLASSLVHAPTGDFRDWETIRSWSRQIGNVLAPKLATPDTNAQSASG